jgi:HEAT repeat protein
MQDPQSLRVLTSLLRSQDFQARARAAQVLARVSPEGLPGDVLSTLAGAISDRDTVVRFYASEALLASGAKAIPALMKVMASERESDRQRATKLISRMGAAAVEPLVTFVRDRSRSPESRAVAAEALGIIGDAKAAPSLIELLRDENASVRSRAAEACGRLGEPAVEALLQAATSSPPEIRASAVDALGLTSSARAVDRIIEALKDSSAIVRAAAVRALGASQNGRAVEPLMAIVRDESSTLRSQASAALGRLGDVAIAALISALRDAHPSVRSLAAEALGDIGSREAVSALIELVKTDQSGARLEALEALSKRKKAIAVLAQFRDPRARDALITALNDANEEVREIAAASLGDVGEQKDLPLLERLADRDQSADVRDAAVKSIERKAVSRI